MSVNIKTDTGCKQVAGNVNPQLINDINQRIDGYADSGYLPKNLLKITNNATTNNGITYTPNADGSVTMNGTASATSIFRIMTSLPNGKYYIHSGIQLSNNLMIQIYDSANNASSITQDNSVVEKDIVEYRIRVASGQTLSNVKIYPMITTKLSAFIPYAQSNVELQSEIETLFAPTMQPVTSNNSNITVVAGGYWKIGKLVIVSIRFLNSANGTFQNVFPLPKPSVQSTNTVALDVSDVNAYTVTKGFATVYRTSGQVILQVTKTSEWSLNGIYIAE